jgi:predicted dehydrogenase/D-arabinose 1-dehydrogenase-like Zn-dependent alcohol dehydrogenase
VKQVLQDLRAGRTQVADVPCPAPAAGFVLVRSSVSLVSAGTERMIVEFGKAGYLQKARQQPEKVRQVLDKIRTDGIVPTIEAVFNKLDQPVPLGYCNVGRVMETGAGVTTISTGDRVVSNGKHAEAVSVPANLCARVPDAVPDEAAAFTVLASIGLQGIRLVAPTLGEAIVVTGLGLIGQLTVQLLRAHGCRVLGLDFDAGRLELARRFGAETVDLGAGQDPIAAAREFSRGRGVDAVIITAATSSNEPVHQAAQMCRKRGRIVLVGVTGLELSRADFYEKELTFQVSCSYGPGRYDPSYEEKGQDYPIGFVRWTEQRNFEAVLDMMADGRLDVAPLVSHTFPIDAADRAYEVVTGSEPSLGILLKYSVGPARDEDDVRRRSLPSAPAGDGSTGVSFIGAGSYATAVLMPAFRAAGARLRAVVSSQGVSSAHAAKKFGFEQATTDTASVIGDTATAAVVVATRHDSHAALAEKALAAGKHVFVEKPLALTLDGLAAVQAAYDAAAARGQARLLMVGFNRRFAPQVQKVKALLAAAPGPRAFVMTVNAGEIPANHWVHDPAAGGGRIVGEACHFIDLLRFLAESPVSGISVAAVPASTRDTVSIQLTFENGSLGTIHYIAIGNRRFPKERLEVFAAGRVLQLDNFRRLTGFGWPGFSTMNLWRQDKGQAACAAAFVAALSSGVAPIPPDEIFEVTRVSIEAAELARAR